MHIYQHIQYHQHLQSISPFISHRWSSHGTQTETVSMSKRGNRSPIHAKMWKVIQYVYRNVSTDPIVMPEHDNRSNS